jgi:hypothetical protein
VKKMQLVVGGFVLLHTKIHAFLPEVKIGSLARTIVSANNDVRSDFESRTDLIVVTALAFGFLSPGVL